MSDLALVTGASGFLGAAIARTLLHEGLRVRVLVRPTSPRLNLEELEVETVEGDLLDPASLRRAAKGARFVFHAAADYRLWVRDPERMRRVNVEGTRAAIEAAAEAGAERIVHTSSVAAVKPLPGGSADERRVYASESEIVGPYKRTKHLAEREALRLAAEGAPVVVANPSAPMGPGDVKPTPTGKIVVDFLAGRMPAYLDTGLNVVHVDDCAHGHWLAATKGRVGERYILAGENLTLEGLFDELSTLTGLPAPRLRLPYPVAYAGAALDSTLAALRGTEPRAPLDAVRMAKGRMYYSSGKAEADLGYRARPARDALRDAAAWFVARGYAPAPPKPLPERPSAEAA